MIGGPPLAFGKHPKREMMFAKDEPIALKIVGGVFEVERLACCRVLGRSHLVLSPAQPFGRARLSHEGEGLRDDDREILAERSEEHTSELQSLMRSSYAVFCMNKKTHH